MKRALVAFGVLLLFIGIVVASSSNTPVERYNGRDELASISRWEMEGRSWVEWTVSANFTKGEVMAVEIEPRTGEGDREKRIPPGWGRTKIFIGGSSKPFNVMITGPSGDEAVFRVFFCRADLLPGHGQHADAHMPHEMLEVPITIENITLVRDSEDLEVRFERNLPREVGGKVKNSGKFTVKFEPYPPLNRSPPDKIAVYREVYEVEYPYRALLPIGVAVNVCGAAFAVYGAKSRSRKRLERPKRLSGKAIK